MQHGRETVLDLIHANFEKLALVSLASKIEQVKNERLRLISAARKAFEDKRELFKRIE